ncbi:MAG TPA: hypothetical protein DEE98_02595 [Elusimicrobia bacterium]|nr:MAG: hypothetical protein A2278_07425 [Elusimicrobia bacterium RIFOXYA12_FULL_49_49]OGS10149.1 MAG: hypothetical protein A2204_03820 [Elusimicrobia bacterium RIFOXYA1_FULL_47_7]OGS16104.1 MAG: hypothetical protein A2251_02840 [Elusimicrobia bacterium RIFOXYA2_FULL_47_53]OGS30144.1 MAG: hypothetical protein A2323_01695 [Elusimicrobia bacterium RIFOXYB2_FULL_46_23]HBU69253.1 hypothetical protein [Elusimicrobiota bacterium]
MNCSFLTKFLKRSALLSVSYLLFSSAVYAFTADSITPSNGYNSGPVNITNLAGSGFLEGSTVTLTMAGKNNINATAVVVAPTQITCTFDLTGAATGLWNVVVTSEIATATITNGFYVEFTSPTVTNSVPNAGNQGDSLSIVINGTAFRDGSAVAFSGTGISASTASVSATQIGADIVISSIAAIGSRNITVTNEDGKTVTLNSAFTVGYSSPIVGAITPSAANQGDSIAVTITGSKFTNGSSVSFSGTGVSATTTTINANSITANVTVTAGATIGTRDLTVTTADGKINTLGSAFTIGYSSPTLTNAVPNSANQGESVSIVLNGTNFRDEALVTFSGTGITASTTSLSATQIGVDLVISPTAATGARNITVTNNDGKYVTLNSGFTIEGSSPVITEIMPANANQAEEIEVTISGAFFVPGTAVSLSGDTDIIVTTTAVSDFSITATLTVSSAAAIGLRNLIVTNPDGKYKSLADAFTVNYASPTILSVLPLSANQGDSIAATISGFRFTNGSAVSLSGTGVTASTTSITDNTITANLTVTADAAVGARDLTVTTSDGKTHTLGSCFSIGYSSPTLTNAVPSSATQGDSVSIVLNGTNFRSGAAVSFSGTGISASTTSLSATQLGVDIVISSVAPAGARNITITHNDGKYVTLNSGFTVENSSPVVTGIAPAYGNQADVISVTVSGSNFNAGASVSLSGTDITASTTAITSNSITATVTISSIAATGTRNLTVTNPGGKYASLASAFTIGLASPVVSGVAPTEANQGDTVSVTISGSKFTNGSSVAFSGTGVSATTTTINANQIVADVTVAAGAAIGARNLTVTTSDGKIGTLAAAFTVADSSPTVSSISPSSGNQSDAISVTISGSNLTNLASVSLGAGITITTTSVSSTQLSANLLIAAGASLGQRNLTVTKIDGKYNTLSNCFTVGYASPTFTNASPNYANQGDTLTVTLNGTNFRDGAAVTISGSGITIATTSVSATQIGALFTISTTAAQGSRSITITNNDGKYVSASGAFTVAYASPTITDSTFPLSSVNQGETLSFTIQGTGFRTGAAVTTDGTGITITPTAIADTQITASMILALTATMGLHNLTVTNDDGKSAVKSNQFEVKYASPTITAINPGNLVPGTTTSVSISGTAFRSGFILSVSGSGVVILSSAITNSTLITASITVSTSAALGSRTLTVTNDDNKSNASSFAVSYPVPTITTVSPNSALKGSVNNVTITGTNFRAGAQLSAMAGITVSGYAVISETQIKAVFTVAADAASGGRDVTITNTDDNGSVTKTAGFAVGFSAPDISSVTPNTVELGNTTTLTVTGTEFRSGITAAISGSGVTVLSTAYVSATEITVVIKATMDAAAGLRNISVTNDDSQTATKDGALTLKAAASNAEMEVSMDTEMTGTIVPVSGEIIVEIPKNTFSEDVTVTISTYTVPASKVDKIKITNIGIEIKNDKSLQPDKEITLTVSYRAEDVVGLDEKKLVLARYDEAHERWIVLPSTVDKVNKRIVATLNHLSKFAVIQLAPSADLAKVYVFPNPFNSNNTSLTFDGLTLDATIKIYTIAGELVRSIDVTDSNGRASWDGKNDSGNKVSSGIYIAYIDGKTSKAKVKIAVEK